MIKLSDFINVLKCVSHAMAERDVRFYLCAVQFVFDGRELTLTAVDGRRVCRATLRLDAELSGSFIVDRKSIKQMLTGYKPARNDCRTIEFIINGPKLAVTDGTMRMDAEVIDAIYPDVDRVLPKGEPKGAPTLGLNLVYIAEAATALKAITNAKYHGVELATWDASTCVRLTCATDQIDSLAGPVVAYIMPMRL